MTSRTKITLAGFLLAFVWFMPWVFLIKLGSISYYPYGPDSRSRFLRNVGPRANYLDLRDGWTPFEEIPSYCASALIVAEDVRFYSHQGIDPRLIESAARRNLKRGRIVWGGSTITQQIVKNLFLEREKTFLRKARESAGALLLNIILSKQSQLAWYLNIAEFGPYIYGIHSAAMFYFHTEPRDLSLSQCISLFSVLPDPTYTYTSLLGEGAPDRIMRRQKAVQRAMARIHRID